MASYGFSVNWNKEGEITPLETKVTPSGWKVEDRDSYVLITKEKGNKKMEIYANKPDHEYSGSEAISKEMENRKLQSIVIVHRGHSYHAEKTIEKIPSIAKIVNVGSCGGYNTLNSILEKSPQAHIISTKGTGTSSVNDPLFKMLNNKIIEGKDIKWRDLWKQAEQKFKGNEHFSNYVPPDENIGAIFIKSYNELNKAKK